MRLTSRSWWRRWKTIDITSTALGAALLLLALTWILVSSTNWSVVALWLGNLAGPTGLAVIGGGLLLSVGARAGLLRRSRNRIKERQARTPMQPLPGWVIAAVAVLIVVVTWTGVSWLLMSLPASNSATQSDTLRLESIKTGLAIGAGTGALIALVFIARRQWLGERTQAYTEHDADERRATELYSKSVEQLGHTQAPVRLGGLYALERLAQASVDQRQTIVDVICAYLRMPYIYPDEIEFDATWSRRRMPRSVRGRPSSITPRPIPPAPTVVDELRQGFQELQVRLTAQRILFSHLQSEPDSQGRPTNPKFWANIDLDLSGATLVNFHLQDCCVGAANFSGVNFVGDAWLNNTKFARDALFDRIVSRDVLWFNEVQFGGSTYFRNADINEVLFEGAKFESHAGFRGSIFRGVALFREAVFVEECWFGGGRFDSWAWFSGVRFGGVIEFKGTEFVDSPKFEGARARVDVPRDVTLPAGWFVRMSTDVNDGQIADSVGVWGYLAADEHGVDAS